jgi:hypothetical protein
MISLFKTFLIAVTLLITQSALAAEMGIKTKSACHFSTQPSSSKEERDNQRIACLKEKARTLSVKNCLKIAQSMEYSTSAEESRAICLNELGSRPNPQECLMITQEMEFADSGDESRWTCLLHKGYRLTRKQCLTFAQEMQYPANNTRAKSYCENHLK